MRRKRIRRLIYVTRGDNRVVSILLRDPYITITSSICVNEVPDFVLEANISEQQAKTLSEIIYASGGPRPRICDFSTMYMRGHMCDDVAISSVSINRYTPWSRVIKIEGLYFGKDWT